MDAKKRSAHSAADISLPEKLIDFYTGSTEIDNIKTVQIKGKNR
jgi:hypothetical protein